jgi:hypothetical protein
MRVATTSLLATLAIGCYRAPATRERPPVPDPCDLVEAMLAFDDPGYQGIYASCGGPKPTRVVDVRAPPSLLPPDERCLGRTFTLYRGEREVTFLIVRLDVVAVGDEWNFSASTYQPHLRPMPDGSLEHTDTYCGAIGGFVEWTGTRWRTYMDIERGLGAK